MNIPRQANEIAVKSKLEGQQLFKISKFKEVIKRTKPHKHDAYFELKDGKPEWIDVKSGINLKDKVEVFGELQEGDQLLVKANEIKEDKSVIVFQKK